ncbi:MAG: hypothetical protein ABIZ07_03510 [Dermatophilaceae bacterium]
MTYDLRRLRVHGLIAGVGHTHRYQLTVTALRTALSLTRVNDRILPIALAHLEQPTEGKLRRAQTAYRHAIDDLARQSGLDT